MPTRAESRDGGVGAAAKHVAEHASAIARLELQLAAAEIKEKAKKLTAGVALTLAAALLGLLLLVFLLAAATAAWTLILPVWASLLVMAGAIGLVAATLGGVGAALLHQGTPPVPEQAIEEARKTTEALRAE